MEASRPEIFLTNPEDPTTLLWRSERLRERARREREARIAAEDILEAKSRELFRLNQTLEHQVAERTCELVAAKEHALALAEHDVLTGLANRASLQRELNGRTAFSCGQQEPFVLMTIDLDNFKDVNDHLGHPAGDALLRQASDRFRSVLPPGSFIARLGGDEFTALCFGPACMSDIAPFCTHLLAELSRPFWFGDREMRISASIGTARFPADAQSKEDLLRFSDLAHYATKRSGRNGHTSFNTRLLRGFEETRRLTADLRAAVANGQIVPWYQPKFDLRTGVAVGFEVLARWDHPDRGPIPPSTFVPLAEEVGLIGDLEQQVMTQACCAAVEWIERRQIDHISLNLSPRHLQRAEFMVTIEDILTSTGIPPHALELEITENHFATADEESLPKLAELARRGLAISLDDFGVGYSNLSYLLKIPLKTIKIDRSFVQHIATSADSRTIVDAIIHLAKAFRLNVVAEGIEYAEQRDVLLELGCQQGQGFLLGRPLPHADCSSFLAVRTRGLT